MIDKLAESGEIYFIIRIYLYYVLILAFWLVTRVDDRWMGRMMVFNHPRTK